MNEFTYARRYRGPLKAALFDWAGTTVDYGSCAPVVAFLEVFRRRGVEIRTDEARAPMGTHKKVHIRQISQLPSVARRWEDVHGRPCTEDDVEEMYRAFVPIQLQCLADYADLVPGCLETVAALRARGLKIGATTGYTTEMMELLTAEAAKRGYVPDTSVCASEVPEGRPAPWMCLENARRLGIYPMEAVVKIDDTLSGIEEGLNAGMWSIGLARSGNEIGLLEAEIAALPPEDFARRLERAYARMAQVGAHYVVDTIADILPCFDDIERRLRNGERP